MASILDLFNSSGKNIEYKSPDKTPMSQGLGEDGSKNIDKNGEYYKNEYKYGINYPKDVDKQINNEDAFQITLGNRSISTAGVRNGALKIAKILPKKAFTRVKNVVDQELSGLRIKHLTSVIDLYGTQLVRITKQSTNLVDDMKVATGGNRRPGLIGTLASPFNKVKEKLGDILGFPEVAIPTFVVNEGKELKGSGSQLFTENRGAEQNTMEYLAKIKKNAAGSIIGKFLKQNANGTPKQIVRNTVGSVGAAAKGAIRKGLFGRGTTLETNEPNRNDAQRTIYGSADNSLSLLPRKDPPDRRYTATMEEMVQRDSVVSPLISVADLGPPGVPRIANLGQTISTPINPLDQSNNYGSWLNTIKIENKFNGDRKYDRLRTYLTNPDQVSSVYDGSTMERGDKKYTHGFRTKFNKKLFEIGKEDSTYDEYIDNVVVKIGSIRFHNVSITGLSETLSPSWSSFRMSGSPFNAYVYDSIERSVSFNIKLYALNPEQHKQNWDNIKLLTALVYPTSYIGDAGAVTPPITQITIGDIYIDKSGFIESLSYTMDDESTWEVGRAESEVNEYKKLFENYYLKDGNFVQLGVEKSDIWDSVNKLGLVKNYKAPKLVEIQIGFKFIESRKDAGSYGFKENSADYINIQPLVSDTTPPVVRRNTLGGQFGKFSNPTSMQSFDNITNATNNKFPNPPTRTQPNVSAVTSRTPGVPGFNPGSTTPRARF